LFSAPILLFVAILTFTFGQDHPAGKWSERHNLPATALAIKQGHEVVLDGDEKLSSASTVDEKDPEAKVIVQAVTDDDADLVKSTVDVAINERLTLKSTIKILTNPLTWLPAMAYLTTFGVELAIDSQMAAILFNLFSKKRHGFDQTTAGYYTAVLCVLVP
jgi:NNP family nitrate/nitrite transporter-like MFS transporter